MGGLLLHILLGSGRMMMSGEGGLSLGLRGEWGPKAGPRTLAAAQSPSILYL